MIELSKDTFTRQMLEDIVAAASTSSTQSWPNRRYIVSTTQLSVLHNGFPYGIANAAGQPSMSDLLDRRFTAPDHFRHVDNMVADALLLHLSGASTTLIFHLTDKAIGLLRRLPPQPPPYSNQYWFLHLPQGVPDLSRYTNSGESESESSRRGTLPWDDLQAVTRFSTVTLKVGIIVAACEGGPVDDALQVATALRSFLLDFRTLREALGVVIETAPKSQAADVSLRDLVSDAFLYTTWTRCSQLFLHLALDAQARSGYDARWAPLLAFKCKPPGVSVPSIEDDRYDRAVDAVPGARAMLDGPRSMCKWALRLLRSDRPAGALDYRRFLARFAEQHGTKPARCLFGKDETCKGDHPTECGRFKDDRLVLGDQSVHAQGCAPGRCRKLVWDRGSYVAVRGPVAVAAEPSLDGRHVAYRPAKASTMAISHVWSHGHGGRPDTGINTCLHARFSRLARRHGCDGYWMDVMCIPDEHKLRKEAIGYINEVFAASACVLVLDRDIMDVDVSQLSMDVWERLFATVLVCDWNVRAWTMLEAVKGCRGLELLCRDERTVSLRACLDAVRQKGRVDLAILGLAVQHLLPAPPSPAGQVPGRTVEKAGSILGLRHATREGDDVVIWSLLSNRPVCFTPQDFWAGLVGTSLPTAFLVSDTARLPHAPGFSWAPATPYVRGPTTKSGAKLWPHLAYDGLGSQRAVISPAGLRGTWLAYDYRAQDDDTYRDVAFRYHEYDGSGALKTAVFEDTRVVNSCWRRAVELRKTHRHVALLLPAQEDRQSVFLISTDPDVKNGERGQLVVLCTSDNGHAWTWRGVEDWAPWLELPEMAARDLLIT
ncbi:hypothetical protein HYQ45_004826 [Verticillium longisporum]|uniref:Heterokaryon incompatibility domain-containing protein n=1 Tax=Verticillium longisporum TaxID=100787 RepID=A0A8I3AU01_VERLO|nr:hypothetical protein HYQ45_004826 [Verticillium longisporum]